MRSGNLNAWILVLASNLRLKGLGGQSGARGSLGPASSSPHVETDISSHHTFRCSIWIETRLEWDTKSGNRQCSHGAGFDEAEAVWRFTLLYFPALGCIHDAWERGSWEFSAGAEVQNLLRSKWATADQTVLALRLSSCGRGRRV